MVMFSSGCVFGLSSLTGSHRSRCLVQAARHILLGPAQAMKKPLVRATRTGNAGIMGVTRMTPRLAAYIACQVCLISVSLDVN